MSAFHFLATQKDRSGYYYVRWDRAIPVQVEAETRAEAYQKLWSLLGDAPRGYGWTWTAKLKRIEATS